MPKTISVLERRYWEFNDQLYGGTKLVRPYSCARIDIDACLDFLFQMSESLMTNYMAGAIGSARIGGATTKSIREGTSNLKISIYFLSSTSKLSQNLKGSPPLLNFFRFPRTQVIYGMFLLRSSNYFLQIHLWSVAIINLGWDLLWTIMPCLSCLDYYFEEIL